MELLESIQKSLIEQNKTHGRTLSTSTNRLYISLVLWWGNTKEGYLFWEILHFSYHKYGTYDYSTIIKLYNLYGDVVFKLDRGYIDYTTYNYGTNTLSTEGFRKLCKEIEKYGIVRKHSEEFN